MHVKDLIKGKMYNFKGQLDKLIYLGDTDNSKWHQFALVGSPSFVWCECTITDLENIEETKDEN